MDLSDRAECAYRSFSEEPAAGAVRTGDGPSGRAGRSRAATTGVRVIAPGNDGAGGGKARVAGAVPVSGASVRGRGAACGMRGGDGEGANPPGNAGAAANFSPV